jgi:hypothetical protein
VNPILALTTTAHVTVVVVTVAAVAFILSLVRRRQVDAKYSLLWFFIGGILVVLALLPGLLEWVSKRVGIIYPATTFLLLAVTFLFLLDVHFSWELSRIDERIRTLAEEIALLRTQLSESRATNEALLADARRRDASASDGPMDDNEF